MERRRIPFRTKSLSRICCEHDVRSNESCFQELELFGYPCLRATGQENDRRARNLIVRPHFADCQSRRSNDTFLTHHIASSSLMKINNKQCLNRGLI